jgi:FlaA1/EpsC-like NDP-sugar epimerase
MRRRIRSAAIPVHRHALPQLVVDGVLVALAYFLAFWLRFAGHPWGTHIRYRDAAGAVVRTGYDHRYRLLFTHTSWWVVILVLAALMVFGQYARLWRFVGQRDYEAVLKGVVLATLAAVTLIALIHPVTVATGLARSPGGPWVAAGTTNVYLPASVIALFLLLSMALLIGARFAVQLVTDGRVRLFGADAGAREVLIVGGGEGGRLVVRELLRNKSLGLRPVGFLDDDPAKQKIKDEHGLKVLGTTEEGDLVRVLDETEPDEVVIAIPSAPGVLRARVVTACRQRGIPVRTTPTVFELLRDGSGRLDQITRQLREIRLEDVLGREPVSEQLDGASDYLRGQVVMVTGAGGSIGAELSRQIARVGPHRLVLVDHAEDNLFEIHRELEEERHVRTSIPVVADCKEEERMREVLAEYRPAVVFHAAAYKHVAMMEHNPVEAIRNNALGTRLVARLCGELHVASFVLVSTDKAVQPATVMGASKALAEWAVEGEAATHPQTRYATVRFGNVLGSSGSVVPIFRRQIEAGGPVTVTDSRMTRFFMTIPEAVQLILRAGSLRDGSGEVFVLDMGQPVRIMDLAREMITLSGLAPDEDIAIVEVGARPGEKFSEDLFNHAYETAEPTTQERILRARHEHLDPDWVRQIFAEIDLLVLAGQTSTLAQRVAELSGLRVTRSGDDPVSDPARRDPAGSQPSGAIGSEGGGGAP